MNLEYVKMFRYGTKEFKLFQDEDKNRYLLKFTDVKNYNLLLQISEIANESPNLLGISGFSKVDDKLAYIVPLVDGRTVEEFIILNKPLSTKIIDDIIYQTCQGLKALHQQSILHRDIKPANIMMTNDDEVLLIDYDISRVYDQVKANDTTQSGTKGYAAPEQFGFMQTTFTTDIFSLGVTIDELCTDLSPLEKLPYVELINKCCEIDPKNRYQSVDEIIEVITEQKTRLFDKQIAQIKNGMELGLSEEETSLYAKSYLNEKQMGVIKHALVEKVQSDIIQLMLDPEFNSKQMWQIKRGALDGLSLNNILSYSKPYFASDEMSIYRSGLNHGLSKQKIYSNIREYELIKNTYELDLEELALVRYGFYNNLDTKLIIDIVKSKESIEIKKNKMNLQMEEL